MSNLYKKSLKIKEMWALLSKIEKENKNTIVETETLHFIIGFNLLWDLDFIEAKEGENFEEYDVIANEISNWLIKLIDWIKNGRLDIVKKHKKQMESIKNM